MLIFDAHLDLSMNALEWNRDLRWTVDDIRKSEEGMDDMRKMKQPFHLRQGRGRETNLFHAEKFAAFFQQPEHNSLAKSSGQRRNPYVHQALADLNLRAAVLG